MHHRIIQRVDPLEIFRIQGVLRADAARGRGAEIGLEQLHHRPDDRQARNVDLLALGFQPADQILLQQGEQHDAGRFLDFIEHAIELLLAAHQRIDMFDRRHVGVLRGHRARHRDQRLTGRIGDQMKMKIIAGRWHRDPCVSCESLWSLPERIEHRIEAVRDNPVFSAQASRSRISPLRSSAMIVGLCGLVS